MSGIAGIVRFDSGPAETGLVDTMASAIAHRGPDGARAWSGGPAALAHLMLHATGESLAERQPLASDDGQRVLVVDGRIDNREELGQRLGVRVGRLPEAPDAALFLAAYEAWGDDFADRIEGDFALAIWDARRRVLVCARDRVGTRPFVYHWDGRRFAFASEVRAVLALPSVGRELDEATVAEHLSGELRSFESTFWRGVRRLPPGQRMIVSADGPRSAFYWSLDLGRRLRYRRTEEYVDHYRALLEDVVRRMSRSHRAVAFEVSGGLDFSALFVVGSGLERQGRLPAPGLSGYTIPFDRDAASNELRYARDVARHVGRDLVEVEPTYRPLAWYAEEAAASADFPGYPNGVTSQGLRAAAHADGSRAVIAGTAGDEVLVGTRAMYADAIWHLDRRSLGRAFSADRRSLGLLDAGRRLLLGGPYAFLPASLRRSVRRLRGRPPFRDVLSPRLKSALKALPAEPPSPVKGICFENHRTLLRALVSPYFAHILEVDDRQSSSLVDVRNPFTNLGMLRFSAEIPEDLLLEGDRGKVLHSRAMAGAWPESLVNRRDKAEFSASFWDVVGEIDAAALKEEVARRSGWVDGSEFDAILHAAQSGRVLSAAVWQMWGLAACSFVARRVRRP